MPPATPDDLPIFVAWLLPTTARLPKSIRFTFSQRIDNLALDVVEDLIEARYTRHKQTILKRANLRLEKLRVLEKFFKGQPDTRTLQLLETKKVNRSGRDT